MYAHTHTLVRTAVRTSNKYVHPVRTYVHVHTYAHVRFVYVRIYICMYVCIYIFLCIDNYMYVLYMYVLPNRTYTPYIRTNTYVRTNLYVRTYARTRIVLTFQNVCLYFHTVRAVPCVLYRTIRTYIYMCTYI
jgi:hypothetical protein